MNQNDHPAIYRIEKDSLGEVKVPADALFGAQTQRAVVNFPISGLRPYKAFIWSMGAIKTAAATVHADLGLLKPDFSEAIIRAGNEVMAGEWDDQFVVDPFQAGAGTSHNMNANEVIANRATVILGGKLGEYLIHPNDHVNMSQSTNDTIPTAIRLGCLWRLPELENALQNLIVAFQSKAVEFDEIIKSGRTHLQDAVPIRLGQEFSGYAKTVVRDLDRIQRSSAGLRRVGIGGSAVGTGLNVPPTYPQKMAVELSAFLKTELYPSDNLFESMQSMADFADFSASLRTLALSLTKIANDLRLLASGPTSGLDEIRLPAVQPGSSIMPGKVNPVMAEMLNMAMYHIIGCDTTVALASQAGQLELNVMMPVIAHNLFEMMQITIQSINSFTLRCLQGITANPEKAEQWLAHNPALITALNPLIGYQAGAELVKEAGLTHFSIMETAVQKAREGRLINIKTNEPVTPVEVQGIFSDIRKLTEGGIFDSGK